MNPTSTRAQEIRAEASKWSLQGDSKLLEFMKEISRNVELHCRETELRINRMCLSGDEMNVLLGNSANRLLALQHSQFVENRVQEDEDLSGEAEKTPEKTVEGQDVRQMSPMTTLRTILGDSVACMNNCYERVNVEFEEDSDDEQEALRNVAFRPLDPYGDRPLPYIIGSKDWKEKWHVGLVDSDSESDADEEAQFSESGSESGQSVSLPSVGGSEADSVWGLQAASNTLAHKSASQISSEDDHISKASEAAFNPVPTQRAYFQPPKLTPRTTVPSNPAPNLFSTSPPKNQGLFDDLEGDDFDAPAPFVNTKAPSIFHDQPETRKTVNLFDDEPPEFEVPPPSAQKNRQSGLFLDSDSENDNTFVPPVKPKTREIPNTAKKMDIPTNLFNDEPPVDDFHEPTKKLPNLFDDNDDEFDSFMSSLSSSSKKNVPNDKVVQESKPKPKLSNLFDDDDPDDFLDTLIKGTKAKSAIRQTKKIEKSQEIVKEVKTETPKETEKLLDETKTLIKKKTNLFDDTDDDDIFKEVVKKPEIVPEKRIENDLLQKDLSPQVEIPEKEQEQLKSEKHSSILAQEEQKEIVIGESLEVQPEKAERRSSNSSLKPQAARRTSTSSQKESSAPPRKPVILPRSLSREENTKDAEMLPESTSKPNDETPAHPVDVSESNDPPATPEDWLKAAPPSFPCPEPPKVPSHQNLFDEPPEDVDQVESNPTKKTTKLSGLFDDLDDEQEDFFEVKPKIQKASNVPLFDDLPPDDDLFTERPERKVISEVFYDDFADSFPPSQDNPSTPSKSTYLFNDEPPDDDDWLQETLKKPSETTSSSDSLRKSTFSRSSSHDEPDEIMSNVRNLIKCHEKPEIPPEEPVVNKPKIVPNKLNKTMAINVAALLPGAKRPSFKNTQENSPEVEQEEETVEEKPIEEKNNENSDNPSLLTNLTKTRVKITQKRRPSTRRGRQETYRKSMIVESEEDSQEITQKSPQTAKETEKKVKINKEVVSKISKKTQSLFESDDEDDSDIFSSSRKSNSSGSSAGMQKSTSEPIKITQKTTSLFGDSDDEDDDLFGGASKNNSTKISAPMNKVEKKVIKKAVAGDDPLADLF